jgi:hypothetical protein
VLTVERLIGKTTEEKADGLSEKSKKFGPASTA